MRLRAFDKLSKKLNRQVKNQIKQAVGTYHFLSINDLTQDVWERVFKLKPIDKIADERELVSLFWTNYRIIRMRSVGKRNVRANEHKTFDYQMLNLIDQYEANPNYARTIAIQPVDLDQQNFFKDVKSNYPVIYKHICGYTITEMGKEVGITKVGMSLRYTKELKKFRQKHGITTNCNQ